MAKKNILQIFIIKELIYIEMYNIHLIHRNKINTFQILVMLENETRSNNKNIKNVDPVIGRFCGGIFIFFAINLYYCSSIHACLLCLPT